MPRAMGDQAFEYCPSSEAGEQGKLRVGLGRENVYLLLPVSGARQRWREASGLQDPSVQLQHPRHILPWIPKVN